MTDDQTSTDVRVCAMTSASKGTVGVPGFT